MTGVELPSGIVTFVFSDIEGSTLLLRRLGDRYEPVLRRSLELLDTTWTDFGGHVMSGAGDSTFAAFGSAGDAIAACVEGQRRLAAEPWPPDGRPRVRMGVHSGLALARGDGYVALAVHQAVRVMTAAHGGQVLVSEECAQAAGDVPGVQLVPLGRFRVRDFDEPTELYRVAAAGLQREFPAIRAVPAEGHNLLRPPSGFVGRDADVRSVVAQAAPGRVLTLLGPGGVGKTRLAVEAGVLASRGWADGVWMVDLAPLHDAPLVGQAVAAAVGAPGSTGSDRWLDALEHLATRRALLVLDNCEHLVADVATRAVELLGRCPGVGIVATSRERLAIPGELVLPVAPLALPEAHATPAQAAALPSVELFLQRARAVRPEFDLDDSNVGAVVGICRRLDGLPLALELAASHLAVLPPQRVLDGLHDRFTLLRSRDRGRPDRQRTMEAALDWSVRLLTDEERVALRRLAVFAKDFSIEAATPALAGDDALRDSDVPELVWRLVEHSLVAVDVAGKDSRYRLLETVRAYAARLLREHDEAEVTAGRLAHWWVERLGPWQPMDRLRAGEISDELENLQALVPLLADAHPDLAQQVACAIGRYYYAVTTPRHGVDELATYARTLTTTSPARISLLTTLAHLLVRSGDVPGAGAAAALADEVQAACGGPPPWDDVAVERALGEVAVRSGRYDDAGRIARGALARDLADRGRVRMLNLRGLASHFAGDDAAAAAAFEQELAVARSLDDDHLAAIAENNLAELALQYGDAATAARHQHACLELGLALGSPVQIAFSLIVAARLTVADDAALAVRLHSKAEQVLSDNGNQLYDEDLEASRRMLAEAQAALATAYDVAREAGRALSLPEAARLAGATLEEFAGRPPTAPVGRQRGSRT